MLRGINISGPGRRESCSVCRLSKKTREATVLLSSQPTAECPSANGEGKGSALQKRRKAGSKKKLPKVNFEGHKTLVEAEIPELPPSVNAMWRSTYGKGGRTYKPKPVKDWQTCATEIIRQDFKRRGLPQYEGLVFLSITVITASRRRMDIDNRVKCLQDCLEPAGVVGDDSQIWDLRVRRRMGNKDLVRVRVVTISEEDLFSNDELYAMVV